ncbi:helix-turn-helix transcriptional regulator [Williamsia sp. 1135]|uniref:helix-turn-helix domain-containing protein n=1 Tax=Williamsia sp. 1135 TaxID=1889262 RepID=UPI00143B350A|nr:helix-turn-helix transcriptional regulator [Williamsia sp. 1135]
MGDLIAAADAAAQAGRAWVAANRRGSALAAYGHTQRVARASGCSTTQAPHRTAATDPFTARQREAIALVAAGLTNVEIAERLTVSVRSVEGHLYRAAQRVGVTSRDELADILNSSRRPDVAELR